MSLKPIYTYRLPTGYFVVYDQRPTFDFKEVKQVHGADICPAAQATDSVEADGIIQDSHFHYNIAIRTADCLPIVVLGENGSALLHAGWRGVAAEIFTEPKIIDLKPYYFFIGPSAQQESFSVTEEFHQNFTNSSHHFANGHFNLQGQSKEVIKSVFPTATVEDCGIDTFIDQRFHSYRRNKTTLRNWNLLVNKLY